MPERGKDDTARFMRAIAAFAAEPEKVGALGRALSSDDHNALASVLDEINETVLRRVLTFRTRLGDELLLEVAERRVLSVIATSECGDQQRAELYNCALTDQDVDAVFQMLDRFCPAQADVFVISRSPDFSAPAEFGGVSVRGLFERLEAKGTSLKLAPVIIQAVKESTALSSSVVAVMQGEKPLKWGHEADVLDALHGLSQKDCVGGASVTLWQTDLACERAVMKIRLEGCMIYVLCQRAHFHACFTLWRKAAFG